MKKIDRIIKEVWDENKEQWCKELAIDIPKLVVDHSSDDTPHVAYVTYQYMSNNLFGNIENITDIGLVKDVTIIYDNLQKDLRNIFGFQSIFYHRLTKQYISFVLCHELRHIWQANYKKQLLLSSIETKNIFKNNIPFELQAEVDADEFAVTKIDKTVAKLLMLLAKRRYGVNILLNEMKKIYLIGKIIFKFERKWFIFNIICNILAFILVHASIKSFKK